MRETFDCLHLLIIKSTNIKLHSVTTLIVFFMQQIS